MIELMFVLSVVSMVFLLVIGAFNNLGQNMNATERLVGLDRESARFGEVLVAEFQGIGGDILDARMSLFVENDVDNSGTDRVTIVSADTDFLPCGIHNINSLGFVTVSIDTLTDTCCIDDTALQHQAVLVSSDQQHWRSVQLERLIEAPDCQVVFASSGSTPGGSSIASSGLTASFDQLPTSDEDFINGTMLIVNVQRFSLDASIDSLVKERDTRPVDGVFEQAIMIDKIKDFQVAVGFDTDPRDGISTDNSDDTDEWLYNHSDDTLAAALGCDSSDTPCIQSGVPRMLQLGFTMIWPMADTRSQASILDGPNHTEEDAFLRSHVMQVFIRNYTFFE